MPWYWGDFFFRSAVCLCAISLYDFGLGQWYRHVSFFVSLFLGLAISSCFMCSSSFLSKRTYLKMVHWIQVIEYLCVSYYFSLNTLRTAGWHGWVDDVLSDRMMVCNIEMDDGAH